MKKIILLSLCFVVVLAGSCKKALEISSTRVVNETNYWNTLEDARAGIMGVYGLTRAALADNNGHWIYGDVRMGSFESPIRQDLKAIVRNDLNAAYPVINQLSNWRRFYAVVNAANIFLERVKEVKAKDARYTENNMNVDIAQVRFLRAFAYFYMVRIWGDVPFITSSRDGSFENRPRSNQNAILEFAQVEMETAALVLPYLYSAGDIQQPGDYYAQSRQRWSGALVRKLSAYAMLAEVAAWQGKYADVIRYSRIVITDMNRGGLSYVSTPVLTNRDGLFFTNSNGANDNQLFGFGFVYNNQDASFAGNLESLTLASPTVNKNIPDIYVPKDSILSIFKETNDGRFNIDTTGAVHADNVYFAGFLNRYPIFSKVKAILNAENDPSFRLFSSAILLTRLEEVTLLRAEAYAVLGETNSAISDLNTIRQRRYNVDQMGLTNQSSTDFVAYNVARHGPVIEAIFKERQKEFMGEGHRFYDRVRYEKIKQNNPQFMQLINTGGIYWPISRDLITQNPLLTQNSYWK
ncbi:RagB/SusD family nutrient uptake outer membrane protein [Mucilaginibacter myungsuensis]|uniref:RagB/SusD family nutrient uptake outer membrane protein n=1 Tax=Mucilaginibacter myungsuensis TaxID=649104 RepID=A0A929PZM1_9SPHI|nr:RagB/SusD family nutrient uptake outer membrane protein [Mucilaginibacter myungsuensis]MBE9664640.1 RagB/SusD family nutrient uptake outer membrane protein [Mucilaginibacter myungsuensis]MDN3601469.1 RagB/SusD family nutrient uptake outer membrane protein [Mucilaginibacter myungsuensis]